jgi:hypothetical protein
MNTRPIQSKKVLGVEVGTGASIITDILLKWLELTIKSKRSSQRLS